MNVYLLKQKTIGTISDLNGNFSLRFDKSKVVKNDTLVFSFIGYTSLKIPFNSIDLSGQLNVILHENTQALDEVYVEGRKLITKEFSIKELDRMKIYLSPLASGDALKVLTALPSSTNTDETANPELRGSQANRTTVFLNGVPVSNPVRNSQLTGIGFFSLFNPELIKSELVYPSNPPLIYGNSSAGMIDIETEDKLESSNYQLSTTLATTGALVSQKINEKSFIQLYGNLMFSDGFLFVNNSTQKQLKNFSSKDFGLNYHTAVSKTISFNFYNYLVSESSNVVINLFTWQDNAFAKTIRNFSIFNLKYFKDKNLVTLNAGTNFSSSNFSFGNLNSARQQKQLYLLINFKHLFSETLSVQTGLSDDNNFFNFDDKLPVYYYAYYHQVHPIITLIQRSRWKYLKPICIYAIDHLKR